MNYLAHLFLSPRDDHSRLGNIMGDFLRDVDQDKLPATIRQGVQLHQFVDSFTDSHSIVRNLRRKFSPKRQRFAGVVLDVVFDHYLIKHWNLYSEDQLDDFVSDSYQALWRQRHLMPDRMEMVVSWMISRDWIRSYAEIEHVGRALDGLASRLKMQHGFHGAVEEVVQHYDTIENGFLEFFPQLCEHVEGQSG